MPGTDRSSHVGGDNSGWIVTGDGNVIHVGTDPETTAAALLPRAVTQLAHGLYDEALVSLGRAMVDAPGSPDLYYLTAIAKLGGQTAALTSLARIREVEVLVRRAIRLEDRGVFHYFLAYLAFDFYDRKFLRASTPWADSIRTAVRLGLTQEEVDLLFRRLAVVNSLPVRP